MCSSDGQSSSDPDATPTLVDGRPVLQPAGNRVRSLDPNNSLKKTISPKTPPPPPPSSPPSRNTTNKSKGSPSTPTSPKLRSPRLPAMKRGNENNNNNNTALNMSSEKINVVVSKSTRTGSQQAPCLESKKSKKWSGGGEGVDSLGVSLSYNSSYRSSWITEAPGSIAVVRREQMALQHAQRKMRIAHYGRSKSAKYHSITAAKFDSLLDSSLSTSTDIYYKTIAQETGLVSLDEKRCTFITANSDPLYVAYHDEEWGVPVHDDKMLFELLVLSGAQVGSDWTSILKKRQDFRDAFSGFDAEIIANLTEKQITSITVEYGIDTGRVRGAVDNANRILEIKKEFGSFDKYIWGFVNYRPMSPQYKFSPKIPVKTSKSESISKDLVRRGFRFTGPTAIHSFMQAAGLTNDHLISCFRHLHCAATSCPPN